MKNVKQLLIIYFGIFGVATFIIGMVFRNLRDNLLPPQIDQQKVVGYAHFFGYPIYLDTVLFFFVILYPIIFFFVLKLLRIKKFK